jgi:hypothetical protein
MKPQQALSPIGRVHNLDVLYTHDDDGRKPSWSFARFNWGKDRATAPLVYALRWNGDLKNPDDKGNPRSHGYGTWFILPDVIGHTIYYVLMFSQRLAEPFEKTLYRLWSFVGWQPIEHIPEENGDEAA